VTGVPYLRLAGLAAAVAILSACGGQPKEPPPPNINLEARLAGIGGSSSNGSAILHQTKRGVDINLWLGSAGPGQYRVAVHENGNCSSPNGFSAGPPWGPPGVAPVSVLFEKGDDTRTAVVSLPGYRLLGPDGVDGRSVVVHAGPSSTLEAQPGVRNNRIACGVIGNPVRMFPGLGN
jgi:superoxide dismutase, Cu-Zn family